MKTKRKASRGFDILEAAAILESIRMKLLPSFLVYEDSEDIIRQIKTAIESNGDSVIRLLNMCCGASKKKMNLLKAKVGEEYFKELENMGLKSAVLRPPSNYSMKRLEREKQEREIKLKLEIAECCKRISERMKDIIKETKEQFGLFAESFAHHYEPSLCPGVSNAVKNSFAICGTSINLFELICLANAVMNDKIITAIPFGSAGMSRFYVNPMDEYDLREWFRDVMFKHYNINLLPKKLLPPLPEIIPNEWL